ncbi:GMC oxidoreductase [Phlyctema vagabunda]|uniref:GMC oxidoreductase n=1 Tax=Phlyctema vagabunda TaxID=108571 RepID=A0ABR4P9H1_9HELO
MPEINSHRIASWKTLGTALYLLTSLFTQSLAWNTPSGNCSLNANSFDFIVVGGGTAGLAVASRLSQEVPEWCILVLEAGADGREEPGITIPGRKGSTFGSKYDWNLTTTPQEGLLGRKVSVTRGKVLGGSSALNLLSWDRGARAEYNSWEELGSPGWNWKSMYASMLKAENFFPSPEYGDEGVGYGGPVQTIISRGYPDHLKRFIPTMVSLGLPQNNESLNGNLIGTMRQPTNIRPSDYTRSYSPAYLELASPNLFVRVDTRDGTILNVSKEVIISAGTYQSPGLLELSGIGNEKVLRAAGINKTVYHLPGVGENFQDHWRIQNSYKLKAGFKSQDKLRYNLTFAAQQLALYNQNQVSLYDSFGPGYAFLNWSQISNGTADSQYVLALNATTSASPVTKKKLEFLTDAKHSAEVPQIEIIASDGYTGGQGYPANGTALYGSDFFTLIAGIMHPFSLGSVHINTSSISVQPLINAGYLAEKYDLSAVIAASKYMQRVANTAPLSSVWESEYEPGPDVVTEEQWDIFVRKNTFTVSHPVGTCAMLPESDGGVVDPELKVYGTSGLRVVDASIIPLLPSAHIQTAVYGIAERAAEFIVAEWAANQTALVS